MLDAILHRDQQLLIYLNNLGSKQWDSFWLWITDQMHWIPLFALIIYLVIKAFSWKRGGFVVFSAILLVAFSDQFTNLIKNSVQRIRPNNNPQIKYLLRHLIDVQGYSFTSGHATTSTFFSVFIVLLLREKYKYIYLILLFPLIFSYSRLYLGVHFPLDVGSGIIIGTIFANLYYQLYKSVDRKLFS